MKPLTDESCKGVQRDYKKVHYLIHSSYRELFFHLQPSIPVTRRTTILVSTKDYENSLGRIAHFWAKLEDSRYSSCQKHTSLSLHAFLSPACNLFVVCFITRLKSKLCTPTTRQNATENKMINLHAQDTTAAQCWNMLAASDKYLTVWLPPCATTVKVKPVLMNWQQYI